MTDTEMKKAAAEDFGRTEGKAILTRKIRFTQDGMESKLQSHAMMEARVLRVLSQETTGSGWLLTKWEVKPTQETLAANPHLTGNEVFFVKAIGYKADGDIHKPDFLVKSMGYVPVFAGVKVQLPNPNVPQMTAPAVKQLPEAGFKPPMGIGVPNFAKAEPVVAYQGKIFPDGCPTCYATRCVCAG